MTRILAIILAGLSYSAYCYPQTQVIEHKIDSLLNLMTLEEKIGQLNQYNGDWLATGPLTNDLTDKIEAIRQGKVGSMINIMGVEHTRVFQEAAMKSRLKIPLLFGQDVIHGYMVTFPIPLAEAASWDMEAIEKSSRVAATEAAAGGIHWTFAPMMDIARDPRWGRVMEGAGEDPYLGSLIARAQVKGFQGNGLGSPDAIMACAKHFAAYGAAVGGRDYNSVDISLRTLWEIYLPPFKAAVDAGVATIMNSLSDFNAIPATANTYLLRDVLKGQWNFGGIVVSDWGSIGEMIPHGYVKDKYQAAEMAIKAGCDMDMESRCYIDNLSKLIADGKVPVEMVNDAVHRILRKKFEMGLFDNPFRFNNADKEKQTLNKKEFIRAAREMACKSIVLLKNEKHLLPLSKDLKSIAIIGPLANATIELKGNWAIDMGMEEPVVSFFDAMEKQAGSTRLLYNKGCDIEDISRSGFAEVVKTALQADIVILAMGEKYDMTGEAKSKANIHLPGVQEELVKAIKATGKPVIVLLMAGRPIVFSWIADQVPAILYTWWLGSQAGNAIADVLYGKYNPSGKLPITFPRAEGQIPIYYNHLNTGRPFVNDTDLFYRSAYTDLRNSPQYAFGHGLSYTTFLYSNLKINKAVVHKNETLTVTFEIKNIGKYPGEEIVQLYLHELVSQPLRPVKELKDFQKVMLATGESRTITFTIDKSKLSFYDEKLEYITQPGEFKLMIGSASDDIRLEAQFELKD
jgi:beta-glucosidase